MQTITATLPAKDVMNAKWKDGKEQVSFYAVSAWTGEAFEQPITVRVWMGRSRNASTVYCALWCHNREGNGRSFSGAGSAGGYGYHKESAALDSAIRSAGISLDRRIRGVGDSAMRDALGAIARARLVTCNSPSSKGSHRRV